MKKSKRTLTPKLRFPEFRETSGWENMTLGDITTKTDKRNKEGKSYPVFSISNKTGFTPQSEQFEGVDSEKRGYDIALYKLIGPKTFAYNPARINVGSIGYSGDLNNVIISSLYVCFKARPDADDQFLLHFLGTSEFEKSVNNHVEGGVRSYLFYENFARIGVPIPPIKEQQKIADCLGSLDALIAAEGRKLGALRDHKRGLIQQLFPQPGQTQPRLRFPEFRDKGVWEEKAISELGEVITGSTPSTTRSEYYGGDRQFVSPADISELRFVRETKTTLTELGFQQTRPIKAKSVLFVCIGSTIGKVAQNLKDCATNQQINSIIAGPGTSADFLYYLLSECSERIAEIAGNQAVPIINKSLFSGFKVLCPKEDEQHRIADCLTALDTQIEAQAAKIDALKTHKRGLMQQLFPAPKEQ